MPKSNKKEKKPELGLDDLDISILQELQKDCRTSVQVIAKNVEKKLDKRVPSSTVHYRIKRLEEQKFIDGYYVNINPERVEMEYLTVMQVRADYGPKYHEKIGNQLAKIPGVWAVYFVLGDWDFIVLTRLKDRAAYMNILEQVMEVNGVERTSTLVVARVIKEDPRLQL
ncbi:MAG: Lrp/AsnC family transcriptional regulator [Candidatus Heimdallarchaeota archaeon]|nr:MAG: Lrp/AsnC family transcriptional regulator [Candidatus Heimdallarchaeota archaeon]